MRYRFIQAHAKRWPIKTLCRVLRVTTSGYYAWRKRPNAKRYREEERLRPVIQRLFDDFDGVYGAPRLTMELRAMGYRVNRKRVERLMREMGLRARQTKRFRPVTTIVAEGEPVAPDLLEQDFSASAPDQRWVGDITYIPTSEGFLFLAVVLDLFSRRIVGWSMGDSLETDLVNDAMRMALQGRAPSAGLIFHSDRGCQYTSRSFRKLLKSAGVRQSMSRKGCCYDNAVAESFFHSLKVEWLNGRPLLDRQQTRNRVFQYIEGFYNTHRRHSSLAYHSPADFERLAGLAA